MEYIKAWDIVVIVVYFFLILGASIYVNGRFKLNFFYQTNHEFLELKEHVRP